MPCAIGNGIGHACRGVLGKMIRDDGSLKVGDVLPAQPFATLEESYLIRAKRGTIRVSTATSGWHVVHTAPRTEPKIKERIGKLGFEAYYPIEQAWTRRDRKTGKMIKDARPFIPGYVFTQLPISDAPLGLIRDIDGVVNFVYSSPHRPALLRSTDLEFFRDLETNGYLDRTIRRRGKVRADKVSLPEWLIEGSAIRITDGPFAGFVAIVKEAMSRIKAELFVFGRLTPIDLALDQIEHVR